MALRVGLTGGIGSGKTAASDRFAELGAAVVDADLIARDVVRKGGLVLAQLVEAFGGSILDPNGELDREALAHVAFADADSTKRLNEITHPAIGVEMVEQVEAAAGRSSVVVVAIPLLKQLHIEAMDLVHVVVVDLPTSLAVERLVAFRGMDEADARARIAAQVDRAERLALATHVVDNAGELSALHAQVDDLWASWQAQPRG